MSPEQVALICNDLRDRQAYRRFYTKTINRQMNAAAALVRRELHLHGLLESGDDKIGIKDSKGIGVAVVSAIRNEKLTPSECPQHIADKVMPHVKLFLISIEPLFSEREAIEKEMRKFARQLPIAEWQAGVKGFGDLALGAVIGTVGNISLYPNPDKLKKRLGLAPYQGRAMSTWRTRGGLTSEDWTRLKYDPKARSTVHADVVDSLMRHQLIGATNKKNGTGKTVAAGPYGEVYIDYKAKQTELYGEQLSKAHIENRTRRYVSQRLIIDLWAAWHRLTPKEIALAA